MKNQNLNKAQKIALILTTVFGFFFIITVATIATKAKINKHKNSMERALKELHELEEVMIQMEMTSQESVLNENVHHYTDGY